MKNKFVTLLLSLVLIFALAAACTSTPEVVAPVENDPVVSDVDDTAVVTPPEEDDAPSFTIDIPAPAGTVIWSLSTNGHIQSIEADTRFAEEEDRDALFEPTVLEAAGSPLFVVVEGPVGNAIQVRNRTADWNAVDFNSTEIDWDFENHTYVLSLFGNVVMNVNNVGDLAVIGGSDSPWDRFTSLEPDENGDFALSIVIDSAEVLEQAGERQWFRLKTTCVEHYTIYEVRIEQQ
jgi:hypothetical protein